MIRAITTVLLALGVLASIWYLPLLYFQCFILIAIGIGLWEYARLVFEDEPTRFFFILLGWTIAALVTWVENREWILVGVIAATFSVFLWVLQQKESPLAAVHRAGSLVLGICYLSIPLPIWGWIHQLGKEWVMLLLFPACLTDTFAFLIGKTFGKHKMAAQISPNKTWEGFGGALFGGLVGLWLALTLFFTTQWEVEWSLSFFVLGILISLLVVAGDLVESLLKRGAGVKDSSHLIPGHGGILDRLDALTFVAPFFYFYLKVAGL